MPDVAFVMSPRQHYPVRELAGTLQYELELQEVRASLHLGSFPECRPDRVYILLDPHDYAAAEGEHALPDESILRRTVFLCTKPPPSDADDAYFSLLRRAGAVFAVDQRSVVTLHRLGIPARLIRSGYSKSLDRFDTDAARPIDVMFLGAHSLRRTRYLSRAARLLSRHNCLLQVSEDSSSPGDTSSFLAEGRWPLLAQTKVLISLHRGDESRLDWRGTLDAIHAGAVVVTEHASGVAPLVPGEHLLVASADALPYVVEELLGDEQRLARMRSQAFERLRSWIPYALSVSILRAAVVELVGEPVPSVAGVGTRRPPPVAADPSGPGDGVERPSKLERWTPAGASIEVAHETPAWASRRAPRVTAVVAVRGEDEQVVPTLDSLVHSRRRDFELVVVAAGRGSEESRQLVADWISEHPRLAALFVVSDRGGLGVGRNIGVDFARAAFSLILDPGQELYPRCLDVLTGTLEAMPEMTFVYPMQEVTGAPDQFVEAGGDYLMSFLGWDPGRLRVQNDIRAPALIRTDRLRALGGFTSDPSMDGLEDYDLWCRMAARGWRGQLVPQLLARRRESGLSRALSAIHTGS
jgi:hypothetical protein